MSDSVIQITMRGPAVVLEPVGEFTVADADLLLTAMRSAGNQSVPALLDLERVTTDEGGLMTLAAATEVRVVRPHDGSSFGLHVAQGVTQPAELGCLQVHVTGGWWIVDPYAGRVARMSKPVSPLFIDESHWAELRRLVIDDVQAHATIMDGTHWTSALVATTPPRALAS